MLLTRLARAPKLIKQPNSGLICAYVNEHIYYYVYYLVMTIWH